MNTQKQISVDEAVEVMLNHLRQNHTRVFTDKELTEVGGYIYDPQENMHGAFIMMRTMGIIELYTTNQYHLADFGFEVLHSGGWVEYNRIKEEDKQRERDGISASIRTNRTMRKNIWLTLGVAAITSLITGLNYIRDGRRENRELKSSSKIEEMQQSIKSLQFEVDSLKIHHHSDTASKKH